LQKQNIIQPIDGNDLCFFISQPGTSLHCKTMDVGISLLLCLLAKANAPKIEETRHVLMRSRID